MIHYNELYQSLKRVSAEWHAGHVEWSYVWSYLKFYENDVVLSVSSNGDIKEIDEWLVPERFTGGKGFFKISNNTIDADIPGAVGKLHLDGCILEKSLILRSTNKEMNLFESWDEYKLVN
jgi:hypothetical protein